MNLKLSLLRLSSCLYLLAAAGVRAGSAPPALHLMSAVQQYDSGLKSFSNFSTFSVVAGRHSLAAYYDLTGAAMAASSPLTICPGDDGVAVSAIHDSAHPCSNTFTGSDA